MNHKLITTMDESDDKLQAEEITTEEAAGTELEKTTDEADEQHQRVNIYTISGLGTLPGLLRRNWLFILTIVVLSFIYVANGYMSQGNAIKIARLRNQVDSARNMALIRSCEFLKLSRQSQIEKYLNDRGDSTLRVSNVSPVVLKIDSTR